jgi:hypothetical protein
MWNCADQSRPDRFHIKQYPLAPRVYLKHLINNRGITVYDAATGAIAFWAGEPEVNEFIRAGKVRVKGTRTRIDRVEWIGHKLTPSWRVGPRAEDNPDGTDMHSSAPYSNKHESDDNISNVWTHAGRSTVLGHAFLSVVAGIGTRIVKSEGSKRKRRSR